MTEMLCITLSPTNVNTIVTCVSIGFSLWAALAATFAACSIRTTYKKVKKAEFVLLTAKIEEVCAVVISEVNRYEKKSTEWNKGGKNDEKLSELSNLITRLNKYYPFLLEDESNKIKNDVKTIQDSMANIHFYATGTDLSNFRDSVNLLDQHLQEIANKYHISLLSD